MAPEENLHGKLQWYLDCYVESDVEAELRDLASGTQGDVTGDVTEIALKALAVGLLYAVEEDATELAIGSGGLVATLPDGSRTIATPPADVVARAVDVVKEIGDLGDDVESRLLSLGLRGDEVQVTARLSDGGVVFQTPPVRKA